MTAKDKILRNAKFLRDSIRLDVVELAAKSWSGDDRSQVRGQAALCVLELNELIKRLSSSN